MKIASLQPSVSIVLERLGRLDALTGCTRYCLDAIPALRQAQVSVLRDSWSASPSSSVDELTALAPDLVIASVPYTLQSLAAILKAGIPVLALAPHRLADVYSDIRLIASIVDARERGEELIAQMERAVESVRQSTSDAARPLVYCEEWGKPLIHSQPWVAELVEAAGGRFLGPPGVQTTPEAIAAADPAVVVMAWCGAGSRVPLERVIAQRGWEHLHAVRERRVYCIRDELLNTPAPTLIDGLHALAAAIHPGLCSPPATAAALRRISSAPPASKLK